MRPLCLIVLAIWAIPNSFGQQLKLSSLEKSVVQIVVVLGDKSIVPCGTGFFVRNDGTIATAFHVYSQAAQVISEKRGGVLVARRVMRTEGTAFNFTMAGLDFRSSDPTHDLVLLKLSSLDQKAWETVGGIVPLSVSTLTEVESGIPVKVVGYFGTDALPVTTRAALVGGAPVVIPGNEIEEFLVSASAVPGESGGPVILDDGSVIGVILSIVPVTVPFANQPIPSGLNRVAKAESLQRLLSSLPK
jgi:S1-C subfamily serine protease